MGDGDGWVDCRCGARHWGRFGAVGLLLAAPGPHVLMQKRAAWTHQGGKWGLPGGARDSDETPVEAALREAREEAGPVTDGAKIVGGLVGTDHGVWTYAYVVALAADMPHPRPNEESERLDWVPLGHVGSLDLIAPLAHDWSTLAAMLSPEAGMSAPVHRARATNQSLPSSNSPTSFATASDSMRNPSCP